MVTSAIFSHPAEDVTVNVYVVVTIGFTVMLTVVSPVLQRKLCGVPPQPDRVTGTPIQTVVSLLLKPIGIKLTSTSCDASAGQPFDVVPGHRYGCRNRVGGRRNRG